MICPKCKVDLFLEFPKNNSWHPCDYYKCPICLSHNRHRLLYLYLKDRDNGKMLEYSPVKITKETFNHTTADFPPRDNSDTGVVRADYNDDLTNSQFKDNEFDTVICSHVLDSIQDEDKAIKELYRITKKTAIVSAPIFEGKTIEYGELRPENFKHFRKPGEDYIERFKIFQKVELIKGSEYKDASLYGLEGEYLIICHKISNS